MPGLSLPLGWSGRLGALFSPVARAPALGLAVSGGPDSLALMLLAAAWAAQTPGAPRLVVYSLDHGLRGEAAAEVAFVLEAARRLGLEARGLRWDGAKPASGVQAAARAARYWLIGRAMRADRVPLLLTAHHRDDQAETVLMRLAHGSGLGGLRGMDAFATVEGVPVFRPLLDVPRTDLAAVVAAAGLSPVADPSNADLHYERVRWRAALPELAALGLDAARLSAFARRAGEADAALGAWADKAFAEHVTIDDFGAAQLPAAALAGLPRAVAVRLLSSVLSDVGGAQKPDALSAVERLHDALGAGPLRGATLLGCAVSRHGADLWFVREPGRRAPAPSALAPAATLVWDRRFVIANGSPGPLTVKRAGGLTRAAAERLLGAEIAAPAAAIRGAPLVLTADADVVALGRHVLDGKVAVALLFDRAQSRPFQTSY